jgi:hypothetical protein
MRFLLVAGNIWFITFRCEMIGSEDLNGKHSEVSGETGGKRSRWVDNMKMYIVDIGTASVV